MKLTLKAAAKACDTPYRTFYDWLVASGVPTTRIGNYKFVDLDSARAVVAQHANKKKQTGLTF